MQARLPTVCILAGGLGTRLGRVVADTPKPLLEVAGEPFLIHQLRLLAGQGAERAVICVGYLGERIVDRIGDRQFGISIEYSHDGPTPIGTLGAIRKTADLLGPRFLVLYGDTYLRLDYRRAAQAWEASDLPGLMTVLRNDGQWDVSNAEFDGTRVARYDKRDPTPEMRWIDYGLGGLTQAALACVGPDVIDLSDLYHELSIHGCLCGVSVTERFYEIGTPAALAETGEFLAALRDRG
jgi:NDP-sugar pyrophosphorylase family protein